MAGTTRKVKRQWSKFTSLQSAGTAIEDAFKCFYEEINHLVTDAASLLNATFLADVKTALNLDTTCIGDVKTALNLDTTCIGDVKTAINLDRTLVLELQTLLNQARNLFLYQPLGNPTFVINSNFDFKNSVAIPYLNAGTLKTLAINQNFDTGTAATIATTKWGVAAASLNSSGSPTVTWFTNTGTGYNSEAAAIAAITGLTVTDTQLGYVTVQAAGSTWTAGTDALATGTGGTPATTTNYYNLINPNAVLLGATSASPAGASISSSPGSAVSSSPGSAVSTAPIGTSDLVASALSTIEA